MKSKIYQLAFITIATAAASCGGNTDTKSGGDTAVVTTKDTAKPAEQPAAAPSAWVNIFDGKTLAGWHGFNNT